jgi:hypothetical protein
VRHRVRMAEHAVLLTLVLVHHHGLVEYVLRVSCFIQMDFHMLLIFSCVCFVLSEWWNMYCTQYLYMHHLLVWIDLHCTYVKYSFSVTTI